MLVFSKKCEEWFKDNLGRTEYLKKDHVMTPSNLNFDLKNNYIAWEMVCVALFNDPLPSVDTLQHSV